MTNYIEFSAKIKEQYPQYADVDDRVLAEKMIEKYPEYKEKVTFEEQIDSKPKAEKKNIDLTPSGLLKKYMAGLNAPSKQLYEKAKGNDISLVDAYKMNREQQEQDKQKHPVLSGFGDFATDIAGYSMLPVVGGSGAVPFVSNAAIQGGVPGVIESLKRGGNIAGGAGAGTGIAAALQGINPVAAKGINKVLESDAVQKGLPKVLEGLTSVPAEYSERALQKELAGNSILNGKFDADTAYQPIEQTLRKAKEMLPTPADFGNRYYELGQKALEGMENLKNNAGAEIQEALGKLNNKNIKNSIKDVAKSVINSFGEGGVYNSAVEEAPGLVKFINNSLDKEGLTLRDLHRIKEALYDKGYAAAAAKEGTTAQVARSVAEKLNNYIRSVVPEYQKPNDLFSTISDITRGLEGNTTIGNKLSEIGSVNSAKSGLDQKLKNIDNLLPSNQRFYKEAQDLVNSENEIKNIVNTVGKQYERNPRLLANRTDEAFETAVEDLQKRTGINFMDELNDVRAREALDKFFPGQGGGSGSSQGFGNLLRTALIGGSPTAAVLTHNPMALLGLGAVSPKLMAKGTIKNLGKAKEFAQNITNKAYDNFIKKIITPAAAKGAANVLYGGVEYNDYGE